MFGNLGSGNKLVIMNEIISSYLSISKKATLLFLNLIVPFRDSIMRSSSEKLYDLANCRYNNLGGYSLC